MLVWLEYCFWNYVDCLFCKVNLTVFVKYNVCVDLMHFQFAAIHTIYVHLRAHTYTCNRYFLCVACACNALAIYYFSVYILFHFLFFPRTFSSQKIYQNVRLGLGWCSHPFLTVHSKITKNQGNGEKWMGVKASRPYGANGGCHTRFLDQHVGKLVGFALLSLWNLSAKLLAECI